MLALIQAAPCLAGAGGSLNLKILRQAWPFLDAILPETQHNTTDRGILSGRSALSLSPRIEFGTVVGKEAFGPGAAARARVLARLVMLHGPGFLSGHWTPRIELIS